MRIIMTVLIAISFSLIYPQESKKIQIEIQEVKEEVPFYRTFKIIATNPNPEKEPLQEELNSKQEIFVIFILN
jgi:hypothetical protein